MERIFTKENSLEVKGVAILLMLAFHLFGFPERIPVISIEWIGSPVIKAFQICVPLFLFLGGYGLECVAVKKSIDKKMLCDRIRKLYTDFWWICIPTIVIGMLIDYYPMDIFKMFMEIFGITSDYNGEWWFFSNYLELFLLFIVFQHLLNSNKYTLSKAIITLVILLIFSRLIGGYVNWREYGILGRHIQMILVNVTIFLLGSVFARYSLFEVVRRDFGHWLNLPGISIFLVITPILVRGYLPLIGITELVVVPMFCLGVVNGMARVGGGKILMFFGQHSMNMWLTHTLFIYYYMKKITFITENSIVMYLTVIGCLLTVSILVGKIKKHTGVLNKRIDTYLSFK